MLTAKTVRRKAAVKADHVADTVTLTAEGRYRRRVVLKSDKGAEFLLDLEKATFLSDGDGLVLEDGQVIQVRAANEKLLEVTAATPVRLMRLAWHIGNRHTPAEITADSIFIEEDHVLAEMLRGLGGAVRPVERPFNPESGAYGGHGSDHAHHAHGAAGHQEHGHGHVHGPECRHDHHDHDHHDHSHHDHGHKHRHKHS